MPLTLPLIAIIISALALVVSGITAYFTIFHRGTIEMTRPTQIYFGPDRPLSPDDNPPPRIIIRSLLFSTSKRGGVIENIYIKLTHNETCHNFSIWTYGYEKPVLAGGLFVGETGVEAYHHFLTHGEGSSFRFIAGVYRVEIFAKLLREKSRKSLFSYSIEVTPELALELEDRWTGVYFDWEVDSEFYVPHLKRTPPKMPAPTLAT